MSRRALAEKRAAGVKTITISPDLVLELLKVSEDGDVINGRRLTVIKDEIPRTARALRAGITEAGNIKLLLEDISFLPVPEGVRPDELRPVYHEEDLRRNRK